MSTGMWHVRRQAFGAVYKRIAEGRRRPASSSEQGGAWFSKCFVACAAMCLLTACDNRVTKFATWEGLGPDKWASAWLITRHISPASSVEIYPVNTSFTDDVAFDIPGAPYRRDASSTTFERLVTEFDVTDPIVSRLAKIVHDIEVNFWSRRDDPWSRKVESAFRTMQRGQTARDVPPQCYYAFFDQLADHIEQGARVPSTVDLLPHDSCKVASTSSVATAGEVAPANRLIIEVSVADLLKSLRSGASVMFVDVREPAEFAEGHIPGAINVPIRNANQLDIDELREFDWVIPYCVKDFRAFEMARVLKSRGLTNTAILNPYGLRGWVQSGLPVALREGLPQSTARTELQRCIDVPKRCLKRMEDIAQN